MSAVDVEKQPCFLVALKEDKAKSGFTNWGRFAGGGGGGAGRRGP